MIQRVIRRAILLAICWLIVRTWAVDGLGIPLVISSGSMAPTLLGPHRDAVCADCGLHYTLDSVSNTFRNVAVCPHCGIPNALDNLPELDGEHVLVDRAAFLWRSPRRWEVVAFRSPVDARMICVKRVVGLPGEEVQIRDGDIYINGQLQRKTLKHDIYYTWPTGVEARWGCDRPFRLGADEYFVLGDNSSISDDSRTWSGGAGVPSSLLYGRPFLVHFHARSYQCFGGFFTIPDITQIRLIR